MKRKMASLNNLKGKLSRALNIRSTLRKDERLSLEKVYEEIDKYMLSNRGRGFEDMLRGSLQSYMSTLVKTNRVYIKDKILPLIIEITKEKE